VEIHGKHLVLSSRADDDSLGFVLERARFCRRSTFKKQKNQRTREQAFLVDLGD
jgi:hypothetical protein